MKSSAILYGTILADPPWPLALAGRWQRRPATAKTLAYPTMTVDEICAMPVGDIAAPDCHLWLWTTNQYLEAGFRVMRAWGFKYLAPIHWVKPSGQGNWFIHRTQTMLFGYRERCVFPMARFLPNIFFTDGPSRHSEKPRDAFDLIERISPSPRIELFARANRESWDAWGNECESLSLFPLMTAP